ncbi:carbohydrate ABC transporter permease [Paenibacillus eucommiae]|uniref:Aldouronate transport system permease protein n=1 Tax=Paenibacillus eucommiae TaxID=1355755 RepID=A0ABS4J3V9_9BACL|nr:carbohydrate ABC transporter permease [Paenibacillus eucommiae]MBP1994527.1 putative aldouronate transport system permease protein [Paenibacillus eucommiae]
MFEHKSFSRKLFHVINNTLLISLGVLCLLPFIHIFAISLSSSSAANSGLVTLWPVELNFDAFAYILNEPQFLQAFWVSIQRVAVGTSISLLVTILTAYPLSKENLRFRMRNVYVWYFVITMLIGGGLVPTYMTIKSYGLMNSFWALILPTAVSVYYIVLMLNFFRGLPKELEESSFVDGAGHWTILFRIYLPLSLPSLATIALFTMVGHWNSWFDGLLYMNRAEQYPLQTYLQTMVAQPDLTKIQNLSQLQDISTRTVKTAQIFVGMLPILIVYPFLQRFFIKGIVLGSVKG